MTSDDILRLYVEAGYTGGCSIQVDGPHLMSGAVELFIHNGRLFLISCCSADDVVFPAIGPLKSFDHAWSILAMRGYTVREYD